MCTVRTLILHTEGSQVRRQTEVIIHEAYLTSIYTQTHRSHQRLENTSDSFILLIKQSNHTHTQTRTHHSVLKAFQVIWMKIKHLCLLFICPSQGAELICLPLVSVAFLMKQVETWQDSQLMFYITCADCCMHTYLCPHTHTHLFTSNG